MKDASRELNDGAQHEASGTPSQDDPEPQAEADAASEDAASEDAASEDAASEDAASEDAADTDAQPDVQSRPASDQEGSSEPEHASEPEAEMEAETEAEPEQPSEATGSEEEDETEADAEDERQEDEERPEPSAESAVTVHGEAVADGDDTAAPEDTRPEQADEPEEHRPEDEPRSGTEVRERREGGRTATAEFRLPPRPKPPAASDDLTVTDLRRTTFSTERTADAESRSAASHRPAAEEPQPTRSAPEPAPQPSTRGAQGAETETTAPPDHTAADTALTRPAPDREAPEPRTDSPSWPARPQGPSAHPYPTAHPTVQQALPEARPLTRGGFVDTTRRDGLPTIVPPAAYTAALPRTTPPLPATTPPEIARPPVTEASAQAPAEEPRRKRRSGLVIVAVALVLLVGLVTGQLVRPTPEPTLRLTLSATRHTFGGAAPDIPWPVRGQATLYVEGLGSMGSSGGQAPTPTASVAKVMTAYVFLRDHPLQPGAQGPTFQISPQEAAELPARKQRGESLVEVVAGQAFTEHKALEALMIVSANNIAHELARWDSGDEQAFVQKMNATARSLGMTGTTYSDPSGFDSGTVSTADDQVKLLTAAMKIPVFAEVVGTRTYVPNDGRPPRPGGDVLVGQYGVIGGKTGYTDAAGGNFVFAAHKRTGNVTTTIIGAVMGQRSPSAMGAITVAQRLVIAAENALTSATLAPAGARVALVDDGLGGHTPLRAAAPVTVVGWGGLTVPVRLTGNPPHHAAGGTRLGAVTAGAAVTPLTLDRELKEPSILERLLRLA